MDYTKDDIEVIPPERSQGYLADQHLDTLEQFLESRFRLPGTEYRFGFDALIGLIPGIGDVFSAGLSSVLIADAWKRGARKRVLAMMVANVGLDMVVGIIPFLGDIFDFAFRATTKNLKLHRREFPLGDHEALPRD